MPLSQLITPDSDGPWNEVTFPGGVYEFSEVTYRRPLNPIGRVLRIGSNWWVYMYTKTFTP